MPVIQDDYNAFQALPNDNFYMGAPVYGSSVHQFYKNWKYLYEAYLRQHPFDGVPGGDISYNHTGAYWENNGIKSRSGKFLKWVETIPRGIFISGALLNEPAIIEDLTYRMKYPAPMYGAWDTLNLEANLEYWDSDFFQFWPSRYAMFLKVRTNISDNLSDLNLSLFNIDGVLLLNKTAQLNPLTSDPDGSGDVEFYIELTDKRGRIDAIIEEYSQQNDPLLCKLTFSLVADDGPDIQDQVGTFGIKGTYMCFATQSSFL